MHRTIPLLLLIGVMFILPAFLLRDDGTSISVTYTGSFPIAPDTGEPLGGDCAISPDVAGTSSNKDCAKQFQAAEIGVIRECEVQLGFMPMNQRVTRLKATVVMLRDGQDMGQGSVTIDELAQNGTENSWITASFTSDCGAKRLRLIKATALVAGEPTDLIAAGMIRGTGLVPWLPFGSLVVIGEPASD